MKPNKIIGGTVGMGLPKPNLMQEDPTKGDFVKGKDEFLKQVSQESGQNPCVLPLIEQPTIYPIPKQCAIPELQWNMPVQDDWSVCRAKVTLLNHANRWVLVYGENLDGNNEDLPTHTGTGTLAMKYRAMWNYGNSPSSILTDGTGTIAKKGDEYTDYNGETKNLPGGCGLPSSIYISGAKGLVYFSSVTNGNTTINGKKQRLIPCCVECTIGDFNGVAFGKPHELTLTIDGDTGAFDMSRLGYDNFYTYYTTMPPTYYNGSYSWCQPVTDGFVYLASTDGINWEYKYKVSTPYQPRYEVAHAFRFGQWRGLAVACVRTAENCILLMMFNPTNGEVRKVYKIDDVGSRPMLYTGRDYALLLHTINTGRNQMEALQLVANDTDDITFYRWFTLYDKITWYSAIGNNSHSINSNISKMHILGNNCGISSGKGMSIAYFTTDTNKPLYVGDCVFDNPSEKPTASFPVATAETLGGVKPVAKNDTMGKDVGIDENGKLYTATELTDSKIRSLYALVEKLSAGGTADAELDAFKNAWGISVTLIGISATYTGSSVAVGTALTKLTGISVKAEYSDGSTKAVTDYTLSGTITAGNNTITVAYEGFTTTFVVVGVEEPTDEPILSVSGADMTLMDDTTYADGTFTINAERSYVAYGTGFRKNDICLLSKVDGKNVTVSFDWAIDETYENVGSMMVNLNANVDGTEKRWKQDSVDGVAMGASGTFSKTYTMSAGMLTIGSGEVLDTDNFGVKVMYTKGKATIKNFKIEIS